MVKLSRDGSQNEIEPLHDNEGKHQIAIIQIN